MLTSLATSVVPRIAVPEFGGVFEVVGFVLPGVHDAVTSGQVGVLVGVWLLPLVPEAVDFGVVEPEEWVCGGGFEVAHSAADPDVDLVVRAEGSCAFQGKGEGGVGAVSYTHLRAHETRHDLVCRLLLEKKKN